MKQTFFRAFFLVPLFIVACSDGRLQQRQVPSDLDQSVVVPASGGGVAARHGVPEGPGSVSQMDEALGVPTFTWADDVPADTLRLRQTMSHEEAARAYLADYAPRYGFSATIAQDMKTKSVHDTGSGPVIVQLVRSASVTTFDGEVRAVDVFRDELKLLMRPDHSLVAISGSLTPQAGESATGLRLRFKQSPESALAFAITELSGIGHGEQDFSLASDPAATNDPRYTLSGDSPLTLIGQARVRPVVFPLPQGLEPAYYLELEVGVGDGKESDFYAYVIASSDGRVLFRKNLSDDAHSYRVYATEDGFPLDSPYGDTTPHPAGTPNGYSADAAASAILLELAHGPISTNDPWLADDATKLAGNNVVAFADIAAPNGLSEGDLEVEVTSPGVFDRAFDTALTANASPDQIKAATTNLFYVVNFLHDWFYDAGFDEASGNAQLDNYGRGGKDKDPLSAEAQDNSGRNNANMRTPADGAPPRMQMYVYDNPRAPTVTFSAQMPVSAQQFAGASFGPKQYLVEPDDVFLVEDDTAPSLDGCSAFKNGALVAGKVAVVERGTCPFVDKAKNAELAGVRALLVLNNQPEMLESLGGTAPEISIPVVMIDQESGNALRQLLESGVPIMAMFERLAPIDRDGTLDTLIVAHEWGHYISNRLVHDSAGLVTNQSRGLGEGWGDFLSLLLTVKESDLALPNNEQYGGAYAMAQYTSYGGDKKNGYYYGIRRAPYSTNFEINPLTLKHIQNDVPLPEIERGYAFGQSGKDNAEVHNTGEVWAGMLWECYAALLRDETHGRSFAEKQDLMKRYLVASLKLTPASPTMLEARDAVLAAALANDAKDYELFWQAFARRGAGIRAKGPGKASADNVGVTESFKVGADIAITRLALKDAQELCTADGIFDNGETATLEITLKNVGIGSVAPTALVASPTPGVLVAGGGFVTFQSTGPMQTAKATITVTADSLADITRLDLDVTASDPALVLPPVQSRISFMVNFDTALDASAADDVEAPLTAWTAAHASGAGLTDFDWLRLPLSVEQTVWLGPNLPATSDLQLVSPPLQVASDADLVLSFKHFYALEKAPDDKGVEHAYDGGVIELSLDGTSWIDVGESASPGYTDTLESEGSENPLKGRRAYSGESPGFPEPQSVALNLGRTYAGKTVQLRFRVGNDQAVRFFGWAVDDIALAGITHTPFTKRIPNRPQSCPQ